MRILAALVAATLSLFAQTSAPAGSVGIRLLDAPTNRADDPRARIYIVDHVAPGTTITRHVEVSNGTKDRLTMPVYAAAASVSGEEFHFGDGHATNELTSWITVDPPSVTLGPGAAASATVTIAVPAKATEGERYAVVWAETPPATPQGGGVAAVNRVGVRVYLSVGPGGEPPSDFDITKLEGQRARTGEPVVQATVKNTGKRALDLSGELRLRGGPAGLAAGPFPAKVGGTLGIGESEPVTVTLDKAVPAGPWDATLTLKSGVVEHERTEHITFPATSGTSTVTTKSSSRGTISLIIAIVLGLALLLLILLARRRRRERDARQRAAEAPMPPSTTNSEPVE